MVSFLFAFFLLVSGFGFESRLPAVTLQHHHSTQSAAPWSRTSPLVLQGQDRCLCHLQELIFELFSYQSIPTSIFCQNAICRKHFLYVRWLSHEGYVSKLHGTCIYIYIYVSSDSLTHKMQTGEPWPTSAGHRPTGHPTELGMSVLPSKCIPFRVLYFNHSCTEKHTVPSHRPDISLCSNEGCFSWLNTLMLQADVPISEHAGRV